MRSRKLTAITAGLILGVLAAAPPALADVENVWLHVDVNGLDHHEGTVKITLPLSLVEVAIDSADTSGILKDLKRDKGVDLAKLWKQLKNADLDEFVTIDSDDAKIKVFKEAGVFRVSMSDLDDEVDQMEIRIPFSVMDYLFDSKREGFKLSDMVSDLRNDLPLVLVEARKGSDERVKVWIDQR